MIAGDILTDIFFASIAGMGFGAISNPPRKAFLYIAILAAVGHSMRFCLMNYAHIDIATASFCAALSISLLSIWFGSITHCPMTVLYIPALLPMIPGMYAYHTVLALVKFLQSLQEPALVAKYMQEIFLNGIVTISVVFLLTVGATIPNFIFYKKAYSMTRHRK
ncbi:MAG: threonine/serine exporter family protein [Bacteroidales bacterium]|jgi:uncharacterized membrane protein YjjB (DUF3815 family)|nr:threonine/serine exporter family protein [Bacteroidales bacterium]